MRMPEAPALIVGDVFRVEPTKDYDTKQPDGGCKVAIMSGDGATEVKLSPSQNSALPVPVIPGDKVAWLVRFGSYSVDGNTGLSVAFVARAHEGHIQAVHEVVAEKAAK